MVSTSLPYTISPANWRDLGTLRQLEKVCFPLDAWPLLDLIAVLSLPNIVRLKAVINDQMVGFIAGDRKSKDLAWIATIGVLPEYRRMGIATELLAECEGLLQVGRIKLSVRRGNEAAMQLYEGLGYRRVGLWPAYYTDGTDAVVFEKRR
jgi:ribosomal-protein-alanine N-acetyltransferase